MDSERLAEIDAVFANALELEGEARRAFLDGRCATDPDLRRQVEALLAHAGRDEAPLLEPVRAFAAGAFEPSEVLPPGSTIGAYRVVRQLGRGGMGVVTLGERRDGVFEQQVAIKVLPHAMSSPQAVRRFERERQILARLSHPNIAHLLDGGVDPRGLPYLVMEHVEGVPVDRYCDERRLEIDARLQLVVTVARAVHAAHRSLVIHRDIKPANLLVTAAGTVKLLDFGIAKLVDPLEEDRGETGIMARLLTPTYASPEQVRGAAITTASDVYQLGLLLFELVCGRRPQEATTVSLAELVKVVCDHEAPPPSRAVMLPSAEDPPAEELAARRGTTPARLARRCRGDLDAIVAHALEKDPERRYASAEDLALDLERHLAGRPVRARRPTWGYRTAKFVRRHAAASLAAALATALTVVYAVGVTLQARAISRQQARAELEAQKATEVERFLLDLFDVSSPGRSLGREVTARELLERGAQRAEQELAGQPEVQARMLSTLGLVEGRLGLTKEGMALQRRALDLRRRLLGDEHVEVAESAYRLGLLLRGKGDYAEAASLLEEAVAVLRRLRPGSIELADAVSQLGLLRYNQADYDGAEALFVEGLAVRRALVDRPAAVGPGLTDLGNVAVARGDDARAAVYFHEALDLYRRYREPNHPQIALAAFSLGQALAGMGDFAGAQPLLDEALAIDRLIFPPDHLEIGVDLLFVGDNLMKLGRLAEAEPAFAEARRIYFAKSDPQHPRMATLHHRLGELRRRQKRFAEAEAELGAALSMRRARLGPDHPLVGQVLLSIGWCHFDRGRNAEAEAAWRAALAMVEGGKQLRIERKAREALATLERSAGK